MNLIVPSCSVSTFVDSEPLTNVNAEPDPKYLNLNLSTEVPENDAIPPPSCLGVGLPNPLP